MRLYHATLRRHLPSIRRSGLLTSKSRGKLAAVWLHTASAQTWAVLHTVRRHGGSVQDVVILEVEVPRPRLRRGSHRRLWYTLADVRPADIVGVTGFAVLSSKEVLCGGKESVRVVSA